MELLIINKLVQPTCQFSAVALFLKELLLACVLTRDKAKQK